MSELLLDSLQIKGYRCFENLTIDKLGRVNLIVGKNNVGKTAFLEALWLWINNQASSAHILGLFDILQKRDEASEEEPSSHEDAMSIRNIVFNRPDFEKERIKEEIRIGNGNYLSITLTSNGNFEPPVWKKAASFANPRIRIPFEFISASGLSNSRLLDLWENIEINIGENKVVEAMNIINKDIIDIRFSRHTFTNASAKPVPIVRMKDAKERVPLKSLGDGMNRLLGIALSIIDCENGLLLVDEIENGLHYSVLPDVWKLIFKTARELNVQVFATTHSKDCVEAFAEAADESPEDGMLIRLERHNKKIIAKTIEEENLALAVDYGAEVR